MPLRHQQFDTALTALRKWGARWRRFGLACDLCGDLLVRSPFRNGSSLRLRIQGLQLSALLNLKGLLSDCSSHQRPLCTCTLKHSLHRVHST